MSSMLGSGKRLASKPPTASNALAPHRAEAGPEGLRLARGAGVDVVVEEVAVLRGERRVRRVVVVGAEDRRQLGVGGEAALDQRQRLRVHLDVGVDEDQHVGLALGGAEVARPRRSGARRLFQHRHRVGLAGAGFQRRQTALEGRGAVGRRDDDAKAGGGAARRARVRGRGRH